MEAGQVDQASLHALVVSLEKTGKLRQQMRSASKWWREPYFEPEIEDGYQYRLPQCYL